MVFVTRFGRCFTGISLRHRVVCNIGLCLKNFIVPVYPRYRVRLHLPNRIEIVIVVSVNKNFFIRLIFNITIRRGCPAEELVACGGGEVDIAKRFYGCGRILRVALTAIIIGIRVGAALEIIMIRNRHGLGLIGVDCPQRDVLCDGNLIARVDERAFHFPSAEVFGIFRRKYAGGAAAYILLVIYVFILTLNVCDREAILCGGEERGDCNGAVKLGIYIEQRAVGINPSGGLFRELFKQCLKLFGIRKLCAVRNFNRFEISVRRGRQINRCRNDRRLPLCVERNALCRHRLAGEIIRRAFAKLVIIPTSKREVCGYTGRSCRGVRHIGNILLILAAFGFFRFAAVNERDVIGVAGIVELCTIIIITNTRTYLFVKSKTCNCILVFFCNAQPSIIIRSILVIQFITRTANIFRTSFTRNHFYIIVTCLRPCTRRRSVLIERCSTERHNINACLHLRISILRNIPSALRLFRPLCGNIRAPFSGNGLIC